jgi:hypothetical protein
MNHKVNFISDTEKPDIQVKTYRYGKILFNWTEIKTESFKGSKHLSVIVISEIELVYSTKINVYKCSIEAQ